MSRIIGETLPTEAAELFDKEITTAVVSTVTEDGTPHAMPVHLLVAKDSKTICMALVKGHKTVENIKTNGLVFITVMDGPDIAMGIKGTAQVIREPMAGNAAMSMIEVIIEEVKSDTTPTGIVEQGVRMKHRSDKTAAFFRAMFDELKA